MHLHLEDVIAHYLNIKCTFIIPKYGHLKKSIYYDKPYNFVVDGPVSMQEYWYNISTPCTLEDILTTTLGMLIAQVTHITWEACHLTDLCLPEQVKMFQQVTRDLAFPQPGSLLAAIKTNNIYIIYTSTDEMVIVEAMIYEFQQLMHTLYKLWYTMIRHTPCSN